MMNVKRGYMGSERVLVANTGVVYRRGSGWETPAAPVDTIGEAYATWSDVPAVWMDGCPYWSQNSSQLIESVAAYIKAAA